MADIGGIEAKHVTTETGQCQPQRDLPAKNAPFAGPATGRALSGDDQHEFGALGLRPVQELPQGIVGLNLLHPVQIDACVDCGVVADKLLPFPAREVDELGRRRSGSQ